MSDSIAIKATKDYPFLGVAAGDVLLVTKDERGILICGGLSWSNDGLWAEIIAGLWEPLTPEQYQKTVQPKQWPVTISVE